MQALPYQVMDDKLVAANYGIVFPDDTAIVPDGQCITAAGHTIPLPPRNLFVAGWARTFAHLGRGFPIT